MSPMVVSALRESGFTKGDKKSSKICLANDFGGGVYNVLSAAGCEQRFRKNKNCLMQFFEALFDIEEFN